MQLLGNGPMGDRYRYHIRHMRVSPESLRRSMRRLFHIYSWRPSTLHVHPQPGCTQQQNFEYELTPQVRRSGTGYVYVTHLETKYMM